MKPIAFIAAVAVSGCLGCGPSWKKSGIAIKSPANQYASLEVERAQLTIRNTSANHRTLAAFIRVGHDDLRAGGGLGLGGTVQTGPARTVEHYIGPFFEQIRTSRRVSHKQPFDGYAIGVSEDVPGLLVDLGKLWFSYKDLAASVTHPIKITLRDKDAVIEDRRGRRIVPLVKGLEMKTRQS